MKLNKIEKIIVAVIILGVILVGGAFVFVVPTFDQMKRANETLEANKLEKQNLEQELSRLNTIDDEIKQTKENAITFEGNFYPDLTNYETSEIAMALMKKCNLEAHAIAIDSLTTRDLVLEYYTPEDVEYDLKTFGRAAKDTDENAEEELLEGQFMDGSKKYTVSVSSLTQAVITDENGEEVAPSRYSEKMKKVFKAAICRYAQEHESKQVVACTEATYEVTGKYSDYLKFIDYIYSQPKATMIATVTIPMTIDIEKDEDEDQPTYYIGEDGTLSTANESLNMQIVVEPDTEVTESVTLIFLSVEPMDPLSRIDAGGEKIVVDQRPAVY